MNAVRLRLVDGQKMEGDQPGVAVQPLVDVYDDSIGPQFDAAVVRAVIPGKDATEVGAVFVDDHPMRTGTAHLDALNQ